MQIAASEEDFGRAQRTAGQHDDSAIDAAGLESAVGDSVELDPISGVDRHDVPDQMQRPHLGVVSLGQREVVEVEGVPRFHFAADVAFAEVDAGALLLTLRICHRFRMGWVVGIREVVLPIPVEGDGQIQLTKTLAVVVSLGGLLEEPGALRPLIIRDLLHVEHRPDRVVKRCKLLISDFGRPTMVEAVRLRVDADVCVHERAAADAGALNDGHVRKQSKVEPAVALCRFPLIPHPGILRPPRVIIRRPSPAALQHENAIALLGQSSGRDRASEAAADHDDVERVCHGEIIKQTRRSKLLAIQSGREHSALWDG